MGVGLCGGIGRRVRLKILSLMGAGSNPVISKSLSKLYKFYKMLITDFLIILIKLLVHLYIHMYTYIYLIFYLTCVIYLH